MSVVMKYRVTGKFLEALKEEEFTLSQIAKREWNTENYEALIAIGKDHTVSIVVDRDTIESNPEWFEKVKE